MSRMLAYTAVRPKTWRDAVGDTLLSEFGALSLLHSDGWGAAWHDSIVGAAVRGGEAPIDTRRSLRKDWVPLSKVGMLYLRFASRGAPMSPENTQPFLRDGMAFQHNGALSPRSLAVHALTEDEQARLTGTTDGEVYLQHTLRDLINRKPADALAEAAARMRTLFPAACLNSFAITGGDLFVVHAPGTAQPPHVAFARRGVSVDSLPPGHGDTYNRLSSTVSASGTVIVATTGIDQRGWIPLPSDTVTRITPAPLISVAL